MEMTIPVCGKFRCKFDTKDYDTCDGHRMLEEAEKDLTEILKKEILDAVKMGFKGLVEQFVDIIHYTGNWPVKRVCLLVPMMYQDEEKFRDEVRQSLIRHDLDRLNNLLPVFEEDRKNNYKKYLTEATHD